MHAAARARREQPGRVAGMRIAVALAVLAVVVAAGGAAAERLDSWLEAAEEGGGSERSMQEAFASAVAGDPGAERKLPHYLDYDALERLVDQYPRCVREFVETAAEYDANGDDLLSAGELHTAASMEYGESDMSAVRPAARAARVRGADTRARRCRSGSSSATQTATATTCSASRSCSGVRGAFPPSASDGAGREAKGRGRGLHSSTCECRLRAAATPRLFQLAV